MKIDFAFTSVFSTFLAVCLMSTAQVEAQQVIPLREAIDLAQNNNLQVKQALFQAAITEQDVKQSRMNLYPTLNAGMDGDLRWGRSFDQLTGSLITKSINSLSGSIGSSVPIFEGFQRVNQVRANKFLLLADQSNAERIKSDLVLSVVTTYLEALTNQDLLVAGRQQLALSTSQLEVEQINVDVGNRTLADLSQAQSLVAADELNVTSAQNAYDLSMLNLKQLMEIDPSVSIELEKPPLPDFESKVTAYSAQDVYSQAKVNFSEIRQAAYNADAAKTNIEVLKGGLYPSLSLRGGLSTGYSSASYDPFTNMETSFGTQLGDNFSRYIGISLSIPIFNNFRTRISVKKARISYEKALLGVRQAENNLNKIIHQAVLDLRAAEKSLLSNRQAFESTRQAFDVIRQRYEVGLANSIELSTSQTNMNRAEFDYIQSRYNLVFRIKVIDYYLGKPITFSN